MLDIVIVGHLSIDHKWTSALGNFVSAGGVPSFALPVLSRLGKRCAVVGSVPPSLHKVPGGTLPCTTVVRPTVTDRSVEIEIRYDDTLSTSVVRFLSRASPISLHSVGNLVAPTWWLAPLLPNDLDLDILRHARRTAELVVLDAQGYCRTLVGSTMISRRHEYLTYALSIADVVKLSASEARAVVGNVDLPSIGPSIAAMGASEVIITDGVRGSWLTTRSGTVFVSAAPALTSLDPTGCGDTYLAAYVGVRQRRTPEQAAWLAGHAAARKVRYPGPLPLPNHLFPTD